MATSTNGASSKSTGPPKSTDHDSVVSVRVPSRGPYGVVLEDDGTGRAAVIRGWEKVAPEGRSGAIERHGGVRLGDVLVGVNEIPTVELAFGQVLELLRDEKALKKVLHFSSRAEVERRRTARGIAAASKAEAKRFNSRVRRARVQEPVGGSGSFAEYEVVCSLRLDADRVEHVEVRRWEVWRRYSEFEKLEAQLKKSLGWHLEGLAFPPKHTFVLDKLDHVFLENRRSELDKWWQRVVAVDRACDFHMHHCDQALKFFLAADEHLARQPTTTSDPLAENVRTAAPANPRRRPALAKGGRPASLKSGLSKRRLAASTSSKNPDHEPRTRAPAKEPPAPPVAPASPAPTQPPAMERLPSDPRRAALLSQISSLKIDD